MVCLTTMLHATPPLAGRVRFIGIDGHGGSGKSSLAAWLAEKLGTQLIHTDDFASWNHPLDWWPRVINEVFRPLAAGAQTLTYQRSQWWPGQPPELVTNQPATDVMIVEGVAALRQEFRPYISLGIFVDTPEATCLERGIARDQATGKSRAELTKLWHEWLIAENRYFEHDNPKAAAAIVVDGTKPFAEQLRI